MSAATAHGATWRGWGAHAKGSSRSVTSARLPAEAAVRSRMFPKTRSWFALGAPLELLSPLSVLRIIYALAVVLWPVEGIVLGWPSSRIWVLVVATATSAVVWGWLRCVKQVSPAWCHTLAAVGIGLVGALVEGSTTSAMIIAATLFLIPIATFVALYLGTRGVVVHQFAAAAVLWFALLHPFHAGSATLVVAVFSITTLAAAMTVRILIIAVWQRGSVDPDTGLANGVGLSQRLTTGTSRTLSFADSPYALATVLLAGVDDARQALGYHVGTELLRRAIEDLGQIVPATTVIARVEADDLVVAFDLAEVLGEHVDPRRSDEAPQAALAAGRTLAHELIATIASGRYLVDGVEVSLRAHVGLVLAPWDGGSVGEFIRRSSICARRAAASGQSVVTWEGDRDAMTGEDLALLADLRLAIGRGELWIGYQPQVAAEDGTIVSVEALLRWNSPTHGKVSPARFINLAERTGLIDRLTEWVMGEALDAQARWRRSDIDVPVSVNLSAKTLSRPELASWILSELDRRELPATALTIEVTETAATDLLQAVHLLGPLHDRGIRVSIDDFGTGYTSLAAIPYLPLDEIKVDMGFVMRSTTSPADEAIVRCVHELAHRLGLVTVAEGVEDDEIRHLMVDIGFDLLQGYHFAKGLPEPDLLEYVRTNRLAHTASR